MAYPPLCRDLLLLGVGFSVLDRVGGGLVSFLVLFVLLADALFSGACSRRHSGLPSTPPWILTGAYFHFL